jgi:hypothetical protein
VVVVDPPRAGLAGKALRRVGRLGATRLVYVSCNPTTLAGDVKALVTEYGYRLERARPVDMFPHTPHIETVAALTLDGDRDLPERLRRSLIDASRRDSGRDRVSSILAHASGNACES